MELSHSTTALIGRLKLFIQETLGLKTQHTVKLCRITAVDETLKRVTIVDVVWDRNSATGY